MAKYKKKPVVIEAFKWTGDNNQDEDPEWIIKAIEKGIVWLNNKGTKNVNMEILTLEGKHIAKRGDYIIKGVKGELYPCKPDIFEMTYEKIEGEEGFFMSKRTIIHQKYNINELPVEQIVQCHNTLVDSLPDDYMVVTTPTDISKIEGDDVIIVIDTKEYIADELLDIIKKNEEVNDKRI